MNGDLFREGREPRPLGREGSTMPVTTNINKKDSKEASSSSKVCLSGNESLLYNLISDQPVLLDEIAERTDIGIPEISGILLKLQIRKLIRQLPGKQFIRSAS